MEDALASSHGIEIETDKVAVFRRNFYRERERAAKFSGLGLLTPPKDGKHKIWIIHTAQLQGKGDPKETVNASG